MILQIGKAIYSLLTENEELNNLINKKVYPLIANVNTTFPFIVYRRSGIDSVSSKDRLINRERGNIDLIIASDTYNESIEIAEKVNKALIHKRGLVAGINIKDIELVNASEDFIEDTFIQELTYKIEI